MFVSKLVSIFSACVSFIVPKVFSVPYTLYAAASGDCVAVVPAVGDPMAIVKNLEFKHCAIGHIQDQVFFEIIDPRPESKFHMRSIGVKNK